MDQTRWRGWRHTIPTDVAVLALLVLVASVCCLLGVLFPISDQAPVELGRALTPIGFVLAGALLFAGARTPRWAMHGTVAFVSLSACLLISQSATNGGIMMTAWSLAWLAVYVATFFSRRAVQLHVLAMTIGLGVAIAVASVPGTFIEFVMMAVTLWTAAVALGSLSERLRAQADRDHLTGLLNRHGFGKAAGRERALASRTGYPLALAVIDLDGLKAVNDRHGHAAGDRLLRDAARAWERTLRPGDLIARFGGDEFVVLFPATAEEDARTAVERLRGAHPASWCAGVTAWRRDERIDDCLARADAHLYAAKDARGAVPAAIG